MKMNRKFMLLKGLHKRYNAALDRCDFEKANQIFDYAMGLLLGIYSADH